MLGIPPKCFIQNGYLAFALPLPFSAVRVAARRFPHYSDAPRQMLFESNGLCSGAGVGVAIDVEQTRRVHCRVDLGR